LFIQEEAEQEELNWPPFHLVFVGKNDLGLQRLEPNSHLVFSQD